LAAPFQLHSPQLHTSSKLTREALFSNIWRSSPKRPVDDVSSLQINRLVRRLELSACVAQAIKSISRSSIHLRRNRLDIMAAIWQEWQEPSRISNKFSTLVAWVVVAAALAFILQFIFVRDDSAITFTVYPPKELDQNEEKLKDLPSNAEAGPEVSMRSNLNSAATDWCRSGLAGSSHAAQQMVDGWAIRFRQQLQIISIMLSPELQTCRRGGQRLASPSDAESCALSFNTFLSTRTR
jgi:hypothetical protein